MVYILLYFVSRLLVYLENLSMELGIFGQFDHPTFIEALNKIVAAAKKANKAVGILFFNPDDYQRYHNLGIRFLACGADATFVAEGARNMAGKMTKFKNQ